MMIFSFILIPEQSETKYPAILNQDSPPWIPHSLSFPSSHRCTDTSLLLLYNLYCFLFSLSETPTQPFWDQTILYTGPTKSLNISTEYTWSWRMNQGWRFYKTIKTLIVIKVVFCYVVDVLQPHIHTVLCCCCCCCSRLLLQGQEKLPRLFSSLFIHLPPLNPFQGQEELEQIPADMARTGCPAQFTSPSQGHI